MFQVPSLLGMYFGNHWRYICCLLVQWLLLVRWFVGSSVDACCCLVHVCEFEVLGLWLGLFMLPRWFVAWCFLLFTSTLQGLGPFRSYTRKWTCNFVVCRVWRSRYLTLVPCPALKFCSNFFPSSGPYLHAFVKCSCREKDTEMVLARVVFHRLQIAVFSFYVVWRATLLA
jgi:hypothetical protein